MLERRELLSGMNLVSHFDNGTTPYSDVWGQGNFAYIGHLQQQGIDIVDITNPASPILASAFLGVGGDNAARDVVVQGNVAFFGVGNPASGAKGGVYVVDVSDPYHPVQQAFIAATQAGLTGTHSLGVGGNFLYLCDSNNNKVGVWNISNPASPVFVRTILSPKANHIHEVTPIGNRLYTASLDAIGYVDIWDISNVGSAAAPVPLLSEFIAGQAAHTAWPTDDGNFVTVSHEINGGTETIWDIHDLSHPFVASIIPDLPRNQAFAGHQQMIKGNLLYSSWYQAGPQVFDIADPRNPVFVGSYDTYPLPVTDKIQGNWGIYGFLGNDRILASDIQTGLYVLSLPNVTISGKVYRDLNGNGIQDAGDSGIAGRFVYLDSNNNGTFDAGEPHTLTDANGNYTFANQAPGAYRVRLLGQAGFVQTTANPPALSGGLNGTNLTGINFGDFKLVNLSGLVFDDRNDNGTQDPGEPGLAGQTIFLDQNHNGVLDTNTTAVAAQDAPKAIPELGTISSTLFAAGFISPISKITVTLNIAHTFDSDLELDLFSPSGTRDVLVLHRGAGGANFTGTILDDQAATAIAAGTAPFSNSYRPEKPLAAFAGQDANGVWTLRITDANLFNSGTLQGWSINFTTAEPSTTTDSSGRFSFAGLEPATYTVRMVLPTGRVQTTANPGNIAPAFGANVTGLTFGSFKSNAAVLGPIGAAEAGVNPGPLTIQSSIDGQPGRLSEPSGRMQNPSYENAKSDEALARWIVNLHADNNGRSDLAEAALNNLGNSQELWSIDLRKRKNSQE